MRTQAAYIRLALADALIELMRERPYAEIGVSDVCERSGVGRTTFYRHCDCKGGMDCLLIFKLTEGWRSYELLHRDSLAANFGCTLLRYVYDNGELVSLVYENGLTEALRRAFDAMLSAAEIPDGEGGYLASFCSWGYFGIVCRWIERGFAETPEEVCLHVGSALGGCAMKPAYVPGTDGINSDKGRPGNGHGI